jgi:hypothetical protein
MTYTFEDKNYNTFDELWTAAEESHPELSEDTLIEFLEETVIENC